MLIKILKNKFPNLKLTSIYFMLKLGTYNLLIVGGIYLLWILLPGLLVYIMIGESIVECPYLKLHYWLVNLIPYSFLILGIYVGSLIVRFDKYMEGHHR